MVRNKEPHLSSRNLELKALGIINEQSIDGYLLIGRKFATRTPSERLETIVFIGLDNGREIYTGCNFNYNQQSEKLQLHSFQQLAYRGHIPEEVPYSPKNELEKTLFSYILSVIESQKQQIFSTSRQYASNRIFNHDSYRGIPFKEKVRFRDVYSKNPINLSSYVFSIPVHSRDWDKNYKKRECLMSETAAPPIE